MQLENKDKIVTCFWSRDTTGQCLATCDTHACGTSMLKGKNLHSATCHRLIHGKLVKKQFRIFSGDKYSQFVTLQQNLCMNLLCLAVFNVLFICALDFP